MFADEIIILTIKSFLWGVPIGLFIYVLFPRKK